VGIEICGREGEGRSHGSVKSHGRNIMIQDCIDWDSVEQLADIEGVKTHSNHKGSRRLTRRNTGKEKRSLY